MQWWSGLRSSSEIEVVMHQGAGRGLGVAQADVALDMDKKQRPIRQYSKNLRKRKVPLQGPLLLG